MYEYAIYRLKSDLLVIPFSLLFVLLTFYNVYIIALMFLLNAAKEFNWYCLNTNTDTRNWCSPSNMITPNYV